MSAHRERVLYINTAHIIGGGRLEILHSSGRPIRIPCTMPIGKTGSGGIKIELIELEQHLLCPCMDISLLPDMGNKTEAASS